MKHYRLFFFTMALVAFSVGCTQEQTGGTSSAVQITVSSSTISFSSIGGMNETQTLTVLSTSAWTASCSADWVVASPSNGSSGTTTVTVFVYENEGEARSTTINFESSARKGTAETTTVTVSQNGAALTDDIVGTYRVSGLALTDDDEMADQTWKMKIVAAPNLSNHYYLDGIVPSMEGIYDKYGTSCCLSASSNDDGTALYIPCQVVTALIYKGEYVSFMPCTEYDSSDGSFYYNTNYYDFVFVYNSSTGKWNSDTGEFMCSCPTKDVADSEGFYDVVAPPMSMVKIAN